MGSTAQRLYDEVMMDCWPGPAAETDFGLVDQQHYEALYHPIRNGEITIEMLEVVKCNGPKITDLVNRCLSNRHKGIVFSTLYDDMPEEEDTGDAEFEDWWENRPTN
jgi:hypothetical protein